MNNNIKKFTIFVNENDHKDIDPYGEENWNDKNNFDLNGFEPRVIDVESVYSVAVDFGEETLEYKIHYNDDYGWDIELKYALDVSPEVDEFLEEHSDEIREILIRTCRQE